MLSTSSLTENKLYILNARSLSGRPVDSVHCRRGCDSSSINHKVSDLTHKDIGGSPIEVRSVVRVSINDPKARETSSSLECRDTVWVTDHHGVVRWAKRRGNHVSASREIDNNWLSSA